MCIPFDWSLTDHIKSYTLLSLYSNKSLAFIAIIVGNAVYRKTVIFSIAITFLAVIAFVRFSVSCGNASSTCA
jgi:hypothetical protein